MPDPVVLFSIVIPTFKRQDSLFACLDCLGHYFKPGRFDSLSNRVEVIISDDNRDTTLQHILRQNYPWSTYVAGPALGPARNRNHGARHAHGTWLVFTDDDCLPQPGWIEAFASYADHYDLMEGRTSSSDQRSRLDEECPINETGGYLWSCNFAIKSKIFHAMGGFDESFPAPAMEDVELNVRFNRLGLRRAYVASAVVLHPWRIRKGFSFLDAYAASVSRFVILHPEYLPRFSLGSQVINLLRSTKASLFLAIQLRTLRGLRRQLTLDVYSSFAVYKAIRRSTFCP